MPSEANPTASALSVACSALGEIMFAIEARRIIHGGASDAIVTKIGENLRTDEQILEIASNAFQGAVTTLAALGAPEVTATACDPLADEPPFRSCHKLCVELLSYTALHTGRPLYSITCKQHGVIHEATTAPYVYMQEHLSEHP